MGLEQYFTGYDIGFEPLGWFDTDGAGLGGHVFYGFGVIGADPDKGKVVKKLRSIHLLDDDDSSSEPFDRNSDQSTHELETQVHADLVSEFYGREPNGRLVDIIRVTCEYEFAFFLKFRKSQKYGDDDKPGLEYTDMHLSIEEIQEIRHDYGDPLPQSVNPPDFTESGESMGEVCPVEGCSSVVERDTLYDHCISEHGWWDESLMEENHGD